MIHAAHVAALSGLLFVVACSSATPSTDDGSTKDPKSTEPDPKGPKNPKDHPPPGPTNTSNPPPTKPSGHDLGAICTKDGECASNLCVFKGNSPRGVCTKQCNNVTDCPGGFTQWDDCAEVQNVTGKVCIPKT